MSTARVRFPASADVGFFDLEKLLSLLVSAPRHYNGRVRALHVVVHLHVRTLSVWCSLKLPVCLRTHWTNCTDYKDPGYLCEVIRIRKHTDTACKCMSSCQRWPRIARRNTWLLAAGHLRAMSRHCEARYKWLIVHRNCKALRAGLEPGLSAI